MPCDAAAATLTLVEHVPNRILSARHVVPSIFEGVTASPNATRPRKVSAQNEQKSLESWIRRPSCCSYEEGSRFLEGGSDRSPAVGRSVRERDAAKGQTISREKSAEASLKAPGKYRAYPGTACEQVVSFRIS